MVVNDLRWDERGLLPAIVQHADSGAVLMLAWMNQPALDLTLSTGLAHFYSRSRRTLWKKGETSGHFLRVVEIRSDCDHDALLLQAHPTGPTCHTGATSCFFRSFDQEDDDGPRGAPSAIADRLYAVLVDRRNRADGATSYTRSLLDGGPPRILAKIAEEHQELAAELATGEAPAIVHETADLLFHVMVGLVARDVPLAAVWAELARRFGVGGHAEKAARR
jgi:phosphoribosyl-ATP pyrophosphohydrolase/phosphoribosyl-AMP cyclohydrolase